MVAANFLSSLTNYDQLLRQLPPQGTLEDIEARRLSGDQEWKTLLREHGGGLFREDWHRVVLDEGHRINNRSSKSEFKDTVNYEVRLVSNPLSSIKGMQNARHKIQLGSHRNSSNKRHGR